MACLITISLPLVASNFSFKELQPRKAILAGQSTQGSTGIETNILAPCSQSRVVFFVNQHEGRHSTNPIDHFGELVSCCVNVSLRTHETLIGYWVGPESDDDWGYVEAFVNQIT